MTNNIKNEIQKFAMHQNLLLLDSKTELKNIAVNVTLKHNFDNLILTITVFDIENETNEGADNLTFMFYGDQDQNIQNDILEMLFKVFQKDNFYKIKALEQELKERYKYYWV